MAHVAAHVGFRTQAQFAQQFRRRSCEPRQRHVADVADILPTSRRGIETADGKVAITAKESGRPREFRLCVGFVADVVAYRVLLGVLKFREVFLETQQRLGIHPCQAFQNDRTILQLMRIGGAHPFVDEIDHAHAFGIGRAAIIGQDYVAQRCGGAPLRLRESQRPDLPGTIKLGQVGIGTVTMDRRLSGNLLGERSTLQQRHRDGRGEHPLNCRAPVRHSSFLRIRSAM